MPERLNPYPTIQSDLSRQLGGAENLADSIANIFKILDENKRRKLATILEGIKAGVVSPDEALVQGTPGGELFERYFGTKPPGPVRTETTSRPTYNLAQPVNPLEDQEAAAYIPRVEGPPQITTTRTGGFTPQNVDQLKSFLIRERGAGREVSPELEQYAGFTPKNIYQLAAVNPEAAKSLERMKQNPKLLLVYQRALAEAQRNYPEAPPSSHIGYALKVLEAFDVGAPVAGADLKGRSKGQMIEQTKLRIADINKLTADEKFALLREAKTRELDLKEAQQADKIKVDILTRLSPTVGLDTARDIVAHIEKSGNIGDFPISDVARQRIMDAFNQKKQLVDAKVLASQAAMLRAKTGVAESGQRSAEFDVRVQYWNALLEEKVKDRNLSKYIASLGPQIRFMAERLKRDPAAANQEMIAFARDVLGFPVNDPDGVQALWEALGNMIGRPGLGRRIIQPTPVVPQPVKEGSSFNPPRIQYKGSSVIPKVTPKTADEFLRKYGGPPRQ